MKRRLARWIFLLILLALVGCAPQATEVKTDSTPRPAFPAGAETPADINLEASPLETAGPLDPAQAPLPIIIITPAQPNTNPEVVLTPANLDQNEQVAYATQDLATRLKISPEEISLLDVTSVVWRDGSLGCPQPGMMYTQALVEGMRIRLSVGEVIYHYHSGRSGQPFLCENPSPQGDLPASDVTE
jgi:hypothetical protein